MCLLIASKNGNTFTPAQMQESQDSNPHGFGYVWFDRSAKGLRVRKVLKPNAKTWERAIEEVKGNPYIMHWRWATHGSRTAENTHPFPAYGHGPIPTHYMAHNGVISIKTRNDESDSRAFIRQIFNPIIRNGFSLSTPEVIKFVEDQMGGGNKFASIDAKTGDIQVFNEKAGHTVRDTDIWASNTGYQPRARITYVYGDSDDCPWYSYHKKKERDSYRSAWDAWEAAQARYNRSTRSPKGTRTAHVVQPRETRVGTLRDT